MKSNPVLAGRPGELGGRAVKREILYDFPRFLGFLFAEFATGSAVNLTLKLKRDMIIKNLDLEPKIDAMMREFLDSPSRWKELSKEIGSEPPQVEMESMLGNVPSQMNA
ncbi:hypothetical protein Tco_0642345 [Tanacetum coccineum]